MEKLLTSLAAKSSAWLPSSAEDDFENFSIAARETFKTALKEPLSTVLLSNPEYIQQLWQKIQSNRQKIPSHKDHDEKISISQPTKQGGNDDDNSRKYRKLMCAADFDSNDDVTAMFSDALPMAIAIERSDNNAYLRSYGKPKFEELYLTMSDMNESSNGDNSVINDEWLSLLRYRWAVIAQQLSVKQNRQLHQLYYRLFCANLRQRLLTSESMTSAQLGTILNRILLLTQCDDNSDSALNILTFVRILLEYYINSKQIFEKTTVFLMNKLFSQLLTFNSDASKLPFNVNFRLWNNTQLLLLLWSIFEINRDGILTKKLYFDLIEWCQTNFGCKHLLLIYQFNPESFNVFSDIFFESNSHLVEFEDDDADNTAISHPQPSNDEMDTKSSSSLDSDNNDNLELESREYSDMYDSIDKIDAMDNIDDSELFSIDVVQQQQQSSPDRKRPTMDDDIDDIITDTHSSDTDNDEDDNDGDEIDMLMFEPSPAKKRRI